MKSLKGQAHGFGFEHAPHHEPFMQDDDAARQEFVPRKAKEYEKYPGRAFNEFLEKTVSQATGANPGDLKMIVETVAGAPDVETAKVNLKDLLTSGQLVGKDYSYQGEQFLFPYQYEIMYNVLHSVDSPYDRMRDEAVDIALADRIRGPAGRIVGKKMQRLVQAMTRLKSVLRQ